MVANDVFLRSLIMTITMVLMAACNSGASTPEQEKTIPAPAWSLQTANGKTISFPDHASGRPALVLFWATWCPYCKALMPHIQSILDEFPDSGLTVYAISFKDDGDPAAVIGKQGFNFITLVQGDEAAQDYGIKSTPGVFLVDGTGNVRFDLRQIQIEQAMLEISALDLKHSRKAARKAPYYAAAIRKAVDQLLAEPSSP